MGPTSTCRNGSLPRPKTQECNGSTLHVQALTAQVEQGRSSSHAKTWFKLSPPERLARMAQPSKRFGIQKTGTWHGQAWCWVMCEARQRVSESSMQVQAQAGKSSSKQGRKYMLFGLESPLDRLCCDTCKIG